MTCRDERRFATKYSQRGNMMIASTDFQNFKADFQNAVLCWLATVSDDGTPNVTPKEMFSWDGGDQIVIADIASPVTVENIRHHPRICLSFIDVFRQRGFKITGKAAIIPSEDERFASLGKTVIRKVNGRFDINNLILVDIDEVSRVLSPSYFSLPEQNEEEHIRQTLETYSVDRLLYGK